MRFNSARATILMFSLFLARAVKINGVRARFSKVLNSVERFDGVNLLNYEMELCQNVTGR